MQLVPTPIPVHHIRLLQKLFHSTNKNRLNKKIEEWEWDGLWIATGYTGNG